MLTVLFATSQRTLQDHPIATIASHFLRGLIMPEM